MARFIIHVGTAKTGSTTLQQAFSLHRETLLKHGILYPSIPRVSHHTHLLFAFSEETELLGVYGRTTPEKIAESERSSRLYWLDLFRQIDQYQPNIIVISSEYAWGLRGSALKRIVQHIQSKGFTVELVGYLRSPPSFFASKLQQHLKYSSNLVLPRHGFGYLRKYKRLHSLGASAVDVRRFVPSDFYCSCIFRDFLIRHCGLPSEISARLCVNDANASLSSEGVQLMQLYNYFTVNGPRVAGASKDKILIEAIGRCELTHQMSKARLNEELKRYIVGINLDDLIILRDELGINFPDIDYSGPVVDVTHQPVWATEVFPCERDRLAILTKQVAYFLENSLSPATFSLSYLGTLFRRFISRKKYLTGTSESPLDNSIRELLSGTPGLDAIDPINFRRIITLIGSKETDLITALGLD